MDNEKILEIQNLKTFFRTERGISKSVDGVTFTVHKGETVGLVGESGSGKSVTSMSVMRLLDDTPGMMMEGEIWFKGKDLTKLSEQEMEQIRGNYISMIFQEPMTSLNPVYSIGEQIAEVFRTHHRIGRKESWEKAVEMLKMVGIPSPEKRAKQEPHELSGGMRQRVMIAMSLACQPELLIADEPTTALDVTIQAQILDLIKKLQTEMEMSMLLITHDIGVIANTCDRVAVMYAGKIVETLEVDDLFENAKHPYTIGLLKSIPHLELETEVLETIEGNIPSPYDMPDGCAFALRCNHASDICYQKAPNFKHFSDGHSVRCWMFEENWTDTGSIIKEGV
ncbi:ABC transporter ATP-binding protein [Bacillus coreaensis]